MATERKRRTALGLALALLAGSAAGCAAFSSVWPGAGPTGGTAQTAAKDAPPPKVEDCHIMSQGTPQMFICSDGKQYTAHQLELLREQEEAAKPASAY